MTPAGIRPTVRRSGHLLSPDPARVVARLFVPGHETLIPGAPRTSPVLERILALGEAEVQGMLDSVMAGFGPRHRDLGRILAAHFDRISGRIPAPAVLSPSRRLLIGAYFTQEYAFQSAALFNPSMVAHPDQAGLPAGSVRFVMSARGVGEGHISSVQFRTGTIDAHDEIIVDDPGPFAILPESMAATYHKRVFAGQCAHGGSGDAVAGFLLDRLGEEFTRPDLDRAVAGLREQPFGPDVVEPTIERFDWMAACNYAVEFPVDSTVGQRLLMPSSPAEARGMEDVRLVRLAGPDGASAGGLEGEAVYLGTYTAFDGARVAPQMLRTNDFRTFRVSQLLGPAARNKGMAVFPRQVGGQYLAMSRWDRESSCLAVSEDLVHWKDAAIVQTPRSAWELVQVGNCGSPIELDDGWLVLSHGVGPMRQYAISAILLDRADPTKVIGRLPGPLLAAEPGERDGYVPNVTYSCGGMRHGSTLVLPYGVNDSAIRIALVDLPALLSALSDGRAAIPG